MKRGPEKRTVHGKKGVVKVTLIGPDLVPVVEKQKVPKEVNNAQADLPPYLGRDHRLPPKKERPSHLVRLESVAQFILDYMHYPGFDFDVILEKWLECRETILALNNHQMTSLVVDELKIDGLPEDQIAKIRKRYKEIITELRRNH